jgi:flagellar biogenesis protein FliO
VTNFPSRAIAHMGRRSVTAAMILSILIAFIVLVESDKTIDLHTLRRFPVSKDCLGPFNSLHIIPSLTFMPNTFIIVVYVIEALFVVGALSSLNVK